MELKIQKGKKLESVIQSQIIKQAEAQGYYVIKLIKTNKNGIPDLLCIKGGRCTFIEVKSAKGKLSEIQKYRIEELNKFGTNTIVF